MKIVIDDKIPLIHGVFEKYADVFYISGEKINSELVKDADALVIRTRTECNEALLKNASVKFIATATIGHDHIDKTYCESNGIIWKNAPGCNAVSVEQYIGTALLCIAEKHRLQLRNKVLGIVGVGHTGSKVARIAEILGMKVLLNDPPRERNENSNAFVSLETIRKASDFITFHVPLNKKGNDQTFKMVNTAFLNNLPRKPWLLNSSRGSVIDNQDLKSALQNGKVTGAVLDVWENEPGIDLELMNLCEIVTPHIAGYSLDGKSEGTTRSVQAVSRFFNLAIDNWKPDAILKPKQPEIEIDCQNKSTQEIIHRAMTHSYDILKDDSRLRRSPETFEHQRGDYPLRREYPVYTITLKNNEKSTAKALQQIGFHVKKKK